MGLLDKQGLESRYGVFFVNEDLSGKVFSESLLHHV